MPLDSLIHLSATGFDQVATSESEVKQYEPLRAAYKIDAALVVGYEGAPCYTANNRYLRLLAGQRRGIRALGHQHLRRPRGPADVDRLVSAGLPGISVYLPDRNAAVRFAEWPETTWRALDLHHAIISLNIALDDVVAIGLVAITGMEHDPWSAISACPVPCPGVAATDIEARHRPLLDAARYPHLGVKASGVYVLALDRTAKWAGELILELPLAAFGPRRLYWGSDFSCCVRYGRSPPPPPCRRWAA